MSDEVEEMTSLIERGKNALTHYGTKGMKWGVRNDRGHVGEKATVKKIAKADKKFEQTIAKANSGRVTPEFQNSVVSRLNERTRALNDSPKYRNVDLNSIGGKVKADYEKDAADLIKRTFEDAVREVYGSNASGTKKGVYNSETDSIDIVEKDVKHADVIVPDVSIRLTRNKTGHIVSTKVVEFSKEDSELAHYGIKGMRWGVSKAVEGARAAGTAVKARDKAIETARSSNSALKRDYKNAKKQYKLDKKEVGRREAKKALEPVKEKYVKNLQTARQSTSGELAVMAMADYAMSTKTRNMELDTIRRTVTIEDAARRNVAARERQSEQIRRSRGLEPK